MNSKKLKKGFTLVELLAVMAIIGVLMLIAVPRFQAMSDGATKTALRANNEMVIGAVQMFFADNGEYPASFQELLDGGYVNDLMAAPQAQNGETNKSVIPDAVYQTTGGDVLSWVPLRGGDTFSIYYQLVDGSKVETTGAAPQEIE